MEIRKPKKLTEIVKDISKFSIGCNVVLYPIFTGITTWVGKDTTYLKEFKDNWSFALGIITAQILWHGTPQLIRYINQWKENKRERNCTLKYNKILKNKL